MAEAAYHYLNINARAETARMIMHANGFAFDDIRYTLEEFKEAKTNIELFEFGMMPMLRIGDLKLVESIPIAAYLCRRFGYYSNDSYEIYLSESIVSLRNDFLLKYGAQRAKIIYPEPDFEAYMNWLDENLVKYLGWFEGRLKLTNNGDGFFAGNGPTHGDFSVFQTFYDHIYTKPDIWGKFESVFDEHAPKLKAFIKRFPETFPTLKAYLDQKDKTLPL